jgi:hypothetical protein
VLNTLRDLRVPTRGKNRCRFAAIDDSVPNVPTASEVSFTAQFHARLLREVVLLNALRHLRMGHNANNTGMQAGP